ncbi:MAG: class I SAM-dependent methyltransferase [Acidobacteria bacterium]|nr:class I SAM-dependent methyltransferase [Acidobacteriota bacterium]
MKQTLPGLTTNIKSKRFGAWDNWARALLFRRLQHLQAGEIMIADSQGTTRLGTGTELSARVDVLDPGFYRDVVFGGSLGAADSFIRGAWTTDNLTTLLRIFARDASVAGAMERNWAVPANLMARAYHALRRNSHRGSVRNIHAHYDLGNAFFELFLDETMNYSCAIFENSGGSLAQASVAKMERACRKLDLSPADHLLEIGTGWGALAIHAASHYGCRVTTTTISSEQHEYGVRRVREAGLESRITVLKDDYRDISGRYDKLVSIEMIEAVGYGNFDTYFRKCCELLRPDGLMLLQAIVMAGHHYRQYLRSTDFIQKYVFPGSCLPSTAAIADSLSRATDFRLVDLEDLTPHYAETLRRWRRRFLGRRETARTLGYPEDFLRLWEYYLCYCEAGFEERHIGDVQLLLARPANRRPPIAHAIGRAA